MSIKNRLLEHFSNNRELSIMNMSEVYITNPAREVVRNYENVHNMTLNRRKVERKISYYYVYSVKPKDLDKVKELYKQSKK